VSPAATLVSLAIRVDEEAVGPGAADDTHPAIVAAVDHGAHRVVGNHVPLPHHRLQRHNHLSVEILGISPTQ